MMLRMAQVALAAAVTAALSSTAEARTLGLADDFNAVVFGNFTATGGDTEGRLAVGGDATIGWYSVGGSRVNSHGTRDDLIVGGSLTANYGWQVINGNAVYGGTLGHAPTTPNGATRQQSGVLDFAGMQADLTAASAHWGSLASNATSTYQWTVFTIDASDPLLNVIHVDAADWAAASHRVINAPAGSTVLVNIAGQAGAMSGGMALSGVTNDHVVFNFYEAADLDISQIAVLGSVIAPHAHLDLWSGNINGIAVVDSAATWSGGEFHHHGFNGELPPGGSTQVIPEPGSAAVMLGVAAMALGRRRGRGGRQ